MRRHSLVACGEEPDAIELRLLASRSLLLDLVRHIVRIDDLRERRQTELSVSISASISTATHHCWPGRIAANLCEHDVPVLIRGVLLLGLLGLLRTHFVVCVGRCRSREVVNDKEGFPVLNNLSRDYPVRMAQH